jgi:hypothetical protein
MKCFSVVFLILVPFLLSAESLKVSLKVLDRADDGSAIRGVYVYPSAELASGETGSMHIGREKRYPVWLQRVDLGDGVSKEETVYEETPVGLVFSIKYVREGGQITYRGKAMAKISRGTFGTSSTIDSTEVIFYGKTTIGELVQVQFEGPNGMEEEVLIHFGPSE